MKRAAVLIGVNQTGNLPRLNAAAASAVAMRDWAVEQGMDTELVIDTTARVDPARIRAAIDRFVSAGTYEQLLVYFAGHGVNLRYSEYWLLSDAPRDTQAAVNVLGSATLARYCGIPHVVFVSDACRTAADSVQAQFVTGSEIFPNEGVAGTEHPVDLFYACTLGRPAFEVRSPEAAARGFSGVYTNALLSVLEGRVPAAVDWEPGPERRGYVRMRRLKRALVDAVPRAMDAARVAADVFQQPDAHVASEDRAWIALLPPPGSLNRVYRSADPGAPALEPTPDPAAEAFGLILRRVGRTVEEAPSPWSAGGDAVLRGYLDEAAALAAQVATGLRSGEFAAAGTRILHVWTAPAAPRSATSPNSANPAKPGLALLQLEGGRLALLPVFPGHGATLNVDADGDLVDVAYEPATGNMPADAALPARRRELRALAAVASLGGRFHLDEAQAAQLAAQENAGPPLDPALALYAAYADTGQGQRARARAWDAAMRRDFGATWPDLVLLGSAPKEAAAAFDAAGLATPFPVRATGWAALDALAIGQAPLMAGLRPFLTNSPWTLFEPGAEPLLRQLLGGDRA